MCWRKEPECRISVSEALRVLRLWVLNSLRRVLSVDSLYGTSPQHSGASHILEKVAARGQDQRSQERIEELDTGSR